MLSDLICWLSQRRRLTTSLVVIYFLGVSLPHDIGQQAALRAYDLFTQRRVEQVLLALCAIVVVLCGGFCTIRLWKASRPLRVRPETPKSHRLKTGATGVSGRTLNLTGLCLLTVLLVLACYRWLFYATAEVVHLPQYAVLAVLLFALTGSHTRTLYYVAMLALLDEGYQYVFLYNPRWPSLLDINDVVFDLLGGCAACLLMHLDGATGRVPTKPIRLMRSPLVWAPVIAVLICAALHVAGYLGLYPDLEGSERPIMFSRQAMKPYWKFTPLGRPYHQLRPWEGLPIIAGLIATYGALDHKPSGPRSKPKS